MREIYLVDASIYIFRAWFSMPDSIQDNKGRPVNAVYGYVHFLCQLIERQSPAYIAVAFDESLKGSFRNKIYPDYKANRESAPPELKRQFKLCRDITRLMGIAEYASKTHEADDIIGTISHRLRAMIFAALLFQQIKIWLNCLSLEISTGTLLKMKFIYIEISEETLVCTQKR